jgi:hypothetical protein
MSDTYDELSFNEMHGEHDSQDWKDGAALRRLRKALPPDRGFTVTLAYNAALGWLVVNSSPEAKGYGPTIAEAADHCREVMER